MSRLNWSHPDLGFVFFFPFGFAFLLSNVDRAKINALLSSLEKNVKA